MHVKWTLRNACGLDITQCMWTGHYAMHAHWTLRDARGLVCAHTSWPFPPQGGFPLCLHEHFLQWAQMFVPPAERHMQRG
jgi:hypothetical protein